jgi:hypothetical protein
MYIQDGERRLILPWERDDKGMGTLHYSGRFEMHAESDGEHFEHMRENNFKNHV